MPPPPPPRLDSTCLLRREKVEGRAGTAAGSAWEEGGGRAGEVIYGWGVGAPRQQRGGYMSSVFFSSSGKRKEKSFRVQSEDLTENHMRIPLVSRESRVYIMR